MDENKKEYSVLGTVTIGTDEYRDLITEKFEAVNARDEEHDRWYNQYKEAQKYKEECETLKKQVEALTAKIKKCEKFIKNNTGKFSLTGIIGRLFPFTFAEFC